MISRKLIISDYRLRFLPIQKAILNPIVNASTTTEKVLMIYICAAREVYQRSQINNVACVRSADNIADGVTKVARCESLDLFLDEGVLRHKV